MGRPGPTISVTASPNAPLSHQPRCEGRMAGNTCSIRILAAAAALLAGCAPQSQQDANPASSSYVGKSVAEYVADHGSPDSTIPLTESKSLYRWDLGVQGMGPAIGTGLTGGGAPPSPKLVVCSVTVTATAQS